MTRCFFVSDLHGSKERYEKLFQVIAVEHPNAIFLGGDLLPSGYSLFSSLNISHKNYINEYLLKQFTRLRDEMANFYPRVFLILGNDDSRFEEPAIIYAASCGVWEYIHAKKVSFGRYQVYGYSFIPPSPFFLKDWERYDVSRYVDPGSISPEEGRLSGPIPEHERKYSTIKDDLERLVSKNNLEHAIFLFHSPPYRTKLDRAALDGKKIDHVPLDPHLGSIAIRRFIEERQPLLTLHGHVHESARLTYSWQDRIGRTYAFSAAHDGPELALIRFELEDLDSATRELI